VLRSVNILWTITFSLGFVFGPILSIEPEALAQSQGRIRQRSRLNAPPAVPSWYKDLNPVGALPKTYRRKLEDRALANGWRPTFPIPDRTSRPVRRRSRSASQASEPATNTAEAHWVDLDAPDQYGPLTTKESQKQAMEELFRALRYYYGGTDIKKLFFALDLDRLQMFVNGKIDEAETVPEFLGFHPKIPAGSRERLNRHHLRMWAAYVISQIHDGHITSGRPTVGATTLGIRPVYHEGELYVSALSKKYLKPVHGAKIQGGDKIVSINGKPVAHFKNYLLNLIANGTVDARKAEATERILENPHSLFNPLFKNGESVELTFINSKGQTLSGTFQATTVDAVELTRPVDPSQERHSRDEIYERDVKSEYGVKGVVRSPFLQGLYTLANARMKLPDGSFSEPLVEIADIGSEINFSRTVEIEELGVQLATAQNKQKEKRPLFNQEVMNIGGALFGLAPVDRLRALVVQPLGEKPYAVLRIPSYSPDGGIAAVLNEISWIQQFILFLNANPKIETLVIDQQSNPGGAVIYGRLLLEMLSNKKTPLRGPIAREIISDGLIQSSYLNDTPMVGKFDEAKRRADLNDRQKRANEGVQFSAPFRFTFDGVMGTDNPNGEIIPGKDVKPWKGKNLVWIVDSRCASLGEMNPAVIKDSGRGIIIGEQINTMGAGLPLNGHVQYLNGLEMQVRLPFADVRRENGLPIENIGLESDVKIRFGFPDDMKQGWLSHALEISTIVQAYGAGETPAQIQQTLDRTQLKGDLSRVRSSETETTEWKRFQRWIRKPFLRDIAAIQGPVEKTAPQLLEVYKKFFLTMEDLEKSGDQSALWKLIEVPIPYEVMASDPMLNSVRRKDLVLERIKNLLEMGFWKDQPNTHELMKYIRDASLKMKGYYNFGTGCSNLLVGTEAAT
jgi:hypothetical protein